MNQQRRPVLFILRGLPGSGKSWHARGWVAEDPDHRARVSRDDLRLMLRSGGGGWGERVTERRIDIVRDAVILSLLRAGTDCVADSTNLNPVTVGDLARIAHRAGAAYQVIDFTGVPLETCLARNAERESGQRVPEQWIRTMHARFVKGADTAR